MNKPEVISIDGVNYRRSDTVQSLAQNEGLDYVVIRSRDSGCHAGYLKSRNDQSVTLVQSRRLWYWDGASSLSQLAMEGVKKPENCKFPCEVAEIEVLGVCEIIKATATARESINSVETWEQK
ncbi:MAG: hypothetical protein AAFX93_20050 [Verrucomicrobiota bacterium]